MSLQYTADGKTTDSVLLLDGEVVSQALNITVGIDHTVAQDIRGLILVDTVHQCHCFTLMPGRGVILEKPAKDNHTQSEDNNNTSESDYLCTFKLKGASYDCYQKTMAQCRKNLLEGVEMKLEFEPKNANDKNAIKFKAKINTEWLDVGYVDVSMVPKVTVALQKQEISQVKLTCVQRKFIKPVGALRYVGECVITKKGPWLPDMPNFGYNGDLDPFL